VAGIDVGIVAGNEVGATFQERGDREEIRSPKFEIRNKLEIGGEMNKTRVSSVSTFTRWI
jgi:hypothetical protein